MKSGVKGIWQVEPKSEFSPKTTAIHNAEQRPDCLFLMKGSFANQGHECDCPRSKVVNLAKAQVKKRADRYTIITPSSA